MEAVEFYLERSRLLGVLFGIIYLGSLFSLYLLGVSLAYKIFIVIGIVYFLRKNWKIHVSKKANNAIMRVWQNSQGHWGFETRKGQGHKAMLLRDTFKSRFLIILRFKTASKICNVVVPFDSLNQKEYRILCRHLDFF